MSSLGDIQTAAKLREIVTAMAKTTVEKLRPAERIGKVYSVDYTRSVAKIYFPGDSADSLIEARFAADKIPTVAMIDTFATAGYGAAGNIVRVAGGPGAYYILDYVSGIPAIDPSARALVLTNTVTINANVTTVSNQTAVNTGQLNTLNSTTIPGLQNSLTTLNTVTIPQLQTDLGTANSNISALQNVTIPALNTRLTTAENDVNASELLISGLQAKFPIVGTDITDGAISTPKMTANTINGDRITANTLNASKIVAGSIATDRMTANTIDGSVITANTLNADKIVAGSITTDRMTANSISGDRITGNTINGDKVIANTINGDRVIANTINGDRIIANTINGDRLIANTITANKLNVIAGGENLVANSGFENATSYIANWSKYDNAAVATLSSTGGRRGGIAAALSWTAGPTAGIVGLFQSIPGGFKANVSYVVSFYSRGSGDALGSSMTIASNAPAMTHTWVSNPPLTNDWQRYIATYSRAADTTDALFFGVQSGWGTAALSKVVLFDDIQVEEGNLVTAYSPKTSEILPGTINAAMLTADSINGKTITGVDISGSTITGSTIRTAASGLRVEMSSANQDRINFYNASNQVTGYIYAAGSSFNVNNGPGASAMYFGDGGAQVWIRGTSVNVSGSFSPPNVNLPSGIIVDSATSPWGRMINTVQNRAMWVYGDGIYSAEGSLSIGTPFYGNPFVVWSDVKDKSDLARFGKAKDSIRGKSSADSALDIVRKLPVYDYDAKVASKESKVDSDGKPDKSQKSDFTLARQRGIIAQDLHKVAPHLVHDETDDPETGFGMGVDIYGLLATTLAALQELDEEFEAFKKEKSK